MEPLTVGVGLPAFAHDHHRTVLVVVVIKIAKFQFHLLSTRSAEPEILCRRGVLAGNGEKPALSKIQKGRPAAWISAF